MRRVIMTMTLMILFAASTALAMTQQQFEELDTNNDNNVSWEEYKSAAEGTFEQMDVDESGQLNWAEDDLQKRFGARAEPGAGSAQMEREYGDSPEMILLMSEEKFNELDANDDGNLTRDEFMAGQKEQYEQMDMDKSGRLNWKEDDLKQRFGAEVQPGAQSSAVNRQYGQSMSEQDMEAMDKNKDQEVTWEEYRDYQKGQFETMDKDKSGSLNWKEDDLKKRFGAEFQPGAQSENVTKSYE